MDDPLKRLLEAEANVPADGVSSTVSEDDLTQNLDIKPAPKPKKTAMLTPGVFQR